MGLKKQFKTDKSLETRGIVIDYGDTRVTIARAGGANKRFIRLLEAKTRPLRRAIASGILDNERSNAILREVYAKAVVLDWQENVGTAEEPKWEKGIAAEDAGAEGKDLLPVTEENVIRVFNNLPDMFADIQAQAQAGALFRDELNEAAAGN